jgi:hypothetical protein
VFWLARGARLVYSERVLRWSNSDAARRAAGAPQALGLTRLFDVALPREDSEMDDVAVAAAVPKAALAALRAGDLLADGAWPDGVVRLAMLLGLTRQVVLEAAARDLQADDRDDAPGSTLGSTEALPDATAVGTAGRGGAHRGRREAARLRLLAAAWEDAESGADDVEDADT